jgi:hypothetical protein
MLSRRSLLATLLAAPKLRAAPGDPLVLTARRNDFHQLLVPARIGSSPPLWCELDTGGGGPLVFLDAAHAAAPGIQPTLVGRSAGAVEGALAPDWRSRVNFSLGGLKFPEQEVVIKSAPLPGDKDASVGMLVLKAFVVELDHDAAVVRLHDPAVFTYTGPGRSFAFTMQDNNPFTTATLALRGGQRVDAKMVIDTGAVASIAYLSRSFALQNQLAERAVATAPDTMGRTACRIERFSLGPLGVDRPVVHAFGAPGFGGMAEPDGMIPADFLRRFRVFMDYSRSRMILEPNRSYGDPPTFDASGLRVHRVANAPDTMRIYEVLPGTPAAEAGIQAGDLLAALDDVPMQRMSPGMVQEALTREGRETSLLVQRGGEIVTVRLKLRRLL